MAAARGSWQKHGLQHACVPEPFPARVHTTVRQRGSGRGTEAGRKLRRGCESKGPSFQRSRGAGWMDVETGDSGYTASRRTREIKPLFAGNDIPDGLAWANECLGIPRSFADSAGFSLPPALDRSATADFKPCELSSPGSDGYGKTVFWIRPLPSSCRFEVVKRNQPPTRTPVRHSRKVSDPASTTGKAGPWPPLWAARLVLGPRGK
uniref:uncharacterized protein LOC123460782 n=1 Tax=Jaculus jaculus TaxID=51337 RepID=UPI001E1B411F|nr:uncharacterized protein LOC123460782 [Jaculus jaculus]